jgi:VWFA-related protein
MPVAQVAPSPIRPEDPPLTLCILIDNSGSMRSKREGVKAAALALVIASKPGDKVCIVDFNDEVYNDLPLTSDVREMEEALTHIDSRGGSAMRDSVRTTIDQVEQAAHNDRKILVLVTDGNDTSSTVTQEELLGKVKNSGVRVYSIGLLNEADPDQAAAARLALERLAEASGGRAYYPKDLAELGSISQEIANGIRKQ